MNNPGTLLVTEPVMSASVDSRQPSTRTPATGAPGRDLLGIVQVTVPVADLVRSARWYRDLLDLEYVREFGDEAVVTGCALADFTGRYLIALRLRSTTRGEADLRGEHPHRARGARRLRSAADS
jgi:hypothetical protein